MSLCYCIDFSSRKISFFQAELKEKDRLRDEAKKLKRLETSFRTLLSDKFGEDITPESQWEDIVGKIENESAFKAVTGRATNSFFAGCSSKSLFYLEGK